MSDRAAGEASGESGTQQALSDVRGELQRLGYLDHRVERFLLQDALRPERPWQALWHLAVKVGLLIGVPSAVMVSLVLAAVNGHLELSPFDVLPLFLHLLVPLVLGPGLLFLALASLLVGLLRIWHVRRIEATSFGLAVSTAVLAVIAALAQGRDLLHALPRWQTSLLAVVVPLLAFALFKVVHGGLLTLAIRLTDLAPEQPFGHGRYWVGGMTLATFLVMLPVAFGVGRPEPETPAVLPVTSTGRVMIVGVDGVLPEEVDYLLERGELAHWSALAGPATSVSAGSGGGGGRVLHYVRPDVAPISFWATIATGLPSPLHGMDSIDTFRPAGLSLPLRRSGWFRAWWWLLGRLGLASYEPVLANDRRAWAFWELATRGGDPGLVVGWWGTYPVEPMPGTLVGHGSYQMIGPPEGDTPLPVVHPPSRVADLETLADEVRSADGAVSSAMERALVRALGEEAAERVLEKALRPDVFYRRAFVEGWSTGPRIGALYLPGLDIATHGFRLGSLVSADLVRWQLRQVDALLADPPADVDTVLVVLDPGRRGGPEGPASEGRALLWRRDGECAPAGADEPSVPVEPEVLTSLVLRSLGLPQSAELPEPPEVCRWPEPSMRVVTYGERERSSATVEGDEYLRSLQALGYL